MDLTDRIADTTPAATEDDAAAIAEWVRVNEPGTYARAAKGLSEARDLRARQQAAVDILTKLIYLLELPVANTWTIQPGGKHFDLCGGLLSVDELAPYAAHFDEQITDTDQGYGDTSYTQHMIDADVPRWGGGSVRVRIQAFGDARVTSAPAAESERPEPSSSIGLMGCSCGGIGETGSHRPGCLWATSQPVSLIDQEDPS